MPNSNFPGLAISTSQLRLGSRLWDALPATITEALGTTSWAHRATRRGGLCSHQNPKDDKSWWRITTSSCFMIVYDLRGKAQRWDEQKHIKLLRNADSRGKMKVTNELRQHQWIQMVAHSEVSSVRSPSPLASTPSSPTPTSTPSRRVSPSLDEGYRASPTAPGTGIFVHVAPS